MADYPLQSTWQEVDAAAQAFKNGVIVQTTVQAKKTSAMTAPVGVDANGKLWTTPGENNPGGDTPTGGGGYVIPDGGIPETDLSQEVQGKLKTQTAYGFTSQAAYDRFISDYPTALKAGDIVWIGGADGDGVSTQIMYQIQNSGALQKVVTIAAATTTSPDDIADAVNAALAAAKERGEFDGTPGQDGGYYTIDVEQLSSQNVKISFTPSKEGMAEILPKVITLPQGPQGNPGQDGQDGQDGRDAVIWYANVAPSDNIFPLQSLVGPAGATPAPGDMIVSSYTGQGYFITEVDEVVAVFDDHKVQIKGDPGQDGQPGKDGETGARGTGLLPITTAPSSYTTEVNGLTPTYRIALSTVKSQAGVTEVFAGDTIRYSYYHYPVIYVDASYVYCRARVSIRGATGAAGAAGYSPVRGTDYWTASDIAEIKSYVDEAILGGAW